MNELRLIRIEKNGALSIPHEIPDEVKEICQVTSVWHQKTSYEPPWVGYVVFEGDKCVGTCGFKTAPKEGAVEISYGTLTEHQRKGYATAMGDALIRMARRTDPQIIITAQTLPHASASTRVLTKLGFIRVGELIHPEDGLVWEWKYGG